VSRNVKALNAKFRGQPRGIVRMQGLNQELSHSVHAIDGTHQVAAFIPECHCIMALKQPERQQRILQVDSDAC
jgi:hypothetical protein